jgi:hypothetical protein
LCKASLAAALALAAVGHSAAAVFQFTMESSGTGFFDMNGLFDMPEPDSGALLPYTMRMTATLTNPVDSRPDPTRRVWRDFYAAVRIELDVYGYSFITEQRNRYVIIDHYAGVAGSPYDVVTIHADLAPTSAGNDAAVWHSIALPPGLLPFSDTPAPVAFASPDIVRGWIDGGVYIDYGDVFSQIGWLSADAEYVSYTVTAVPEPATYAMTLLGFAVLAGAATLRTRSERKSAHWR